MKRLIPFVPLILLPILGCLEAQSAREAARRSAAKFAEPAAPAPPAAAKSSVPPGIHVTDGTSSTVMAYGMMMGRMNAAQTPAHSEAEPNKLALSRKIIYDAQVDLVVKDVDATAKEVAAAVQSAGGYIAEQSVTGSPGSQRSMKWKLRVPVDQFEPLVQKVVGLGELVQNSRTSQDVTEQYYDVEARIKNKKAEEKSLTKILDERTGKLEEILKIETELSRVRGEIEQLEGKIRVLENLSSLATLTLSVRERENFEPPPPTVADFPTQVARTWENSLHGLIDMGKAIILWTVNWAIWFPFYIIGALFAWLILRWIWRRLPRLIALANTPITPPRAEK